MFKANFIPAYILHRHKYGETSLLLDIFSSEYGRVNLIAKGARRNKKQQSVTFDPYQRYKISWISKSDLGTLTEIETDKHHYPLKASQVFSGFYMNELIINLLHRHEAHPELFEAYEKALKRLSENKSEELVLRYFEKTLLQILGYGLVLDVDVETGAPIVVEDEYCYEFERGPSNDNIDSRTGFRISGKTLIELEAETLEEGPQLREAKLLLRAILSRYLGNRKLASRELYNAFIKVGTPA